MDVRSYCIFLLELVIIITDVGAQQQGAAFKLAEKDCIMQDNIWVCSSSLIIDKDFAADSDLWSKIRCNLSYEWYQIVNKRYRTYLDLEGQNSNAGTKVITSNNTTSNRQCWNMETDYLINNVETDFSINNVETDYLINNVETDYLINKVVRMVAKVCRSDRAAPVFMWRRGTGMCQKWEFENDSRGYFKIKNKYGKYLVATASGNVDLVSFVGYATTTTATATATTITTKTTITTTTTTTATTTSTNNTTTSTTTTTNTTTTNTTTIKTTATITNSNTTGFSDCKCGLAKRLPVQYRIVGGEQTEVNEYPWQVGLVDKGDTYVWCGASLISKSWILTAAHCTSRVTASSIDALLGEHDTKSTTETTMVRMAITQIKVHPQYDKSTPNYDFSMLRMKNDIDFGKYPHIRPICLPSDVSANYDDNIATVSGWGTMYSEGIYSTSKLQEVDVKVLTNSECKKNYGDNPSWITDQMLCANVDGGGKDACLGDSGGPLVSAGKGDGVTAGQNYELIGVVSWGTGCAIADYPGVYSRVTAQLAWISETMESSFGLCTRI